MTDADALVVGGGLAGSAIAINLAQAGRHVTLLEKSHAAHHKVCGEFLSTEAVHYLQQLGIDLSAVGAVPLQRLRLITGRSIVEQPLPFAAYSWTRFALDDFLLQRAACAGVHVRRGTQVDALASRQGRWHAQLQNGDSITADHVFLATGKHDLRGWPRPAGTHSGLVAFKMYYRLTPQQHAALGDTIELMLFPGGYAGLQPVEGDRVNLCLLVTAKHLARARGWPRLESYLKTQITHLNERLTGATPLLNAPLAASHIPYGHLQSATHDRLWCLGDQAAVIPSFCGDGMAIALHSAAVASQHFLRGDSTETYTRQLRAQLGLRLALATRLSQAMVAAPVAAELVRAIPGLLPRIARLTRIPEAALIRP